MSAENESKWIGAYSLQCTMTLMNMAVNEDSETWGQYDVDFRRERAAMGKEWMTIARDNCERRGRKRIRGNGENDVVGSGKVQHCGRGVEKKVKG